GRFEEPAEDEIGRHHAGQADLYGPSNDGGDGEDEVHRLGIVGRAVGAGGCVASEHAIEDPVQHEGLLSGQSVSAVGIGQSTSLRRRDQGKEPRAEVESTSSSKSFHATSKGRANEKLRNLNAIGGRARAALLYVTWGNAGRDCNPGAPRIESPLHEIAAGRRLGRLPRSTGPDRPG